MPSLKGLHCRLECPNKQFLQEVGTTYGDGAVECFTPIPLEPKEFCVRLLSTEYIAPGLAMFVYIDGELQCNRNRLGLKDPGAPLKGPDMDVMINFIVRGHEVKQKDGTMIKRNWSFAALNIDKADTASAIKPNIVDNVGCIEVLVLRCEEDTRGKDTTTAVKGATAPAQGAKPMVKGRKYTATVTRPSRIGGFDGNNDGPDDRSYSHGSAATAAWHDAYEANRGRDRSRSGSHHTTRSRSRHSSFRGRLVNYDSPYIARNAHGGSLSSTTNSLESHSDPVYAYVYGQGPVLVDNGDRHEPDMGRYVPGRGTVDTRWIEDQVEDAYHRGATDAERRLAMGEEPLRQPPGAFPTSRSTTPVNHEPSRARVDFGGLEVKEYSRPTSTTPSNQPNIMSNLPPVFSETTPSDSTISAGSRGRGKQPSFAVNNHGFPTNEPEVRSNTTSSSSKFGITSPAIPLSFSSHSSGDYYGSAEDHTPWSTPQSYRGAFLKPNELPPSPLGPGSISGSLHAYTPKTLLGLENLTSPSRKVHTDTDSDSDETIKSFKTAEQASRANSKTGSRAGSPEIEIPETKHTGLEDPFLDKAVGKSAEVRRLPVTGQSSRPRSRNTNHNRQAASESSDKSLKNTTWNEPKPKSPEKSIWPSFDSAFSKQEAKDEALKENKTKPRSKSWTSMFLRDTKSDGWGTPTGDAKPETSASGGNGGSGGGFGFSFSGFADDNDKNKKKEPLKFLNPFTQEKAKDSSAQVSPDFATAWTTASTPTTESSPQSEDTTPKISEYLSSRATPSSRDTKPHWQFPAPGPAPKHHYIPPDFSDVDSDGNALEWSTPAEPLPAIPASKAREELLSHQVQKGTGFESYHDITRPIYLDSIERPYAVFRFKYRNRAVLHELFPREVAKPTEEEVERMREVFGGLGIVGEEGGEEKEKKESIGWGGTWG